MCVFGRTYNIYSYKIIIRDNKNEEKMFFVGDTNFPF